MPPDSELKEEYSDSYRIAEAEWQNYLSEARKDMEFCLLAQHTEAEWDKAERQGRLLLTFDKTKRQLDLLEGYEQRNRHILKIVPTEGSDTIATTQMTAAVMHVMAGGKGYTGYDVLSTAFKWGSLATGSNLMEIWRDRNGMLRLWRRPYNSFLVDPMTTQPDLSDCGYILTGQWVRGDRVKMLLPEDSDKIDKINPLKTSIRWPFLRPPFHQHEQDIRLHEEYWRRKTDYVKTVLHVPTGREIDFKLVRDRFGDAKAAKDYIESWGPILRLYEKPIDKILYSVFIDKELVYDGENPLGTNDYNHVWLHGEFVPECGRSELKLQPFARALRDPQRAFNRKVNQAFDIVESQIQTGKIMRSQYIENLEDAYKAGQGIHLHVKDSTPEQMSLQEVIQNIQAVDIKPGLFQLLENLDTCIVQAGGMNDEIFGTDDKDNMPGILHKFRTGQALTGKQGIFSGFRSSKRELGMKLVRIMQLNYDPWRVQRLIGELPVRQFYDPDLNRYDCTPTEGLLTDTQRQLQYMELRQLRAEYPDAAQYIPFSLLMKMAPIQYDKETEQMVQQGEQQMKRSQMLQMQNQERLNALVEAQAKADLARSREDISDVQENRANIALKNAQTLTEIRKLEGENQRAPSKEAFDRLLALMDRSLELEKLQIDKQKKESA